MRSVAAAVEVAAPDAATLREHLVSARLAGAVATSPRSTLANCRKLVAGEERYTFGLSDWRTATLREAVDAVRALCAGDPGGSDELDGDGWIDPD
nr:phosphatase [Euzebyales bacterium]